MNWSKLYHTESLSRKGLSYFEDKEMSKGGYIWIYFGFCGVVVLFFGGVG